MLGLGGGAQLGIGLAVYLDDRFSARARAIGAAVRGMRSDTSNLVRGAISDYQAMASRVAMISAGITYGFMRAIKVGARFEQTIQKIAVIGEGTLGKAPMTELAKKLAIEFGKSPQSVAEAIFENTKAGVTTSIDLITKYQLAVATATGEMLEGQEGVAKGLLNIANSMKINYSNFGAVANAVTVAANQSMASVQSLTETMAYSANDFFQLYGGNTQQSRIEAMAKNLAFGAMLSQMGIEGSSAGTAISNLLRYSTTASGAFASKRQMGGLAVMGLKPGDLRTKSGNMMDPLEMMDLFASRMKNLPTGAQLDAMFGVLGVRGKKAGINLMGPDGQGVTSRDMYRRIMQGIKQDIAIQQAKQMMDTLQGDLDKAKAQWASFLIDFTKAVEPLLRKAIPIFAKIISGLSSFMETGLGKGLARFVLVMAPVVAVVFAFRAATLAATLALSSFASMASYRNLMGGGLGLMGMNRMAANGLVQNSAGRWTVAAGRTFDFGGKTYKGGQLLPAAALGANMVGAAAIGAGRLGLGVGARVLGFLGGPWGLGIALGISFLPMIYDGIMGMLHKDDEEETMKAYGKSNFASYIPGYDPGRADILSRLGMGDVAKQEFRQTIQLHVNGQYRGEQNFESKVQDEMDIMRQVEVDLNY